MASSISSASSATTGQTASIKLDRDNYLVWEPVVRPFIKGNILLSHIDGLTPASPPMISEGEKSIPNPAYDDWEDVDSLLLGWLRNNMSLEVASQLLHYTTAYELWADARDLTCASMRSRVMNLKGELNQVRKGSMKMKECLGKMKNLSDQLSLAGAPVTTDDLILHTLNGLEADNNAALFGLNHQRNLNWVEVTSELLAFESRIDQLNQFSSLSIQPSANVAQREEPKNSGASQNASGQTPWRGGPPQGGGGARGHGRGPRYGGRRGGFSGNRSYCGLCEKPGHAVHNCYYRFDRSFQPPTHERGFGGFLNRSSSPTTNHECIIPLFLGERSSGLKNADLSVEVQIMAEVEDSVTDTSPTNSELPHGSLIFHDRSRSRDSLMPSHGSLSISNPGEGKLLEDPTIYRQAIGSLQYLTNTRSDIAFSVNKLIQFLSQPPDVHLQGVKRILRYLKVLGALIDNKFGYQSAVNDEYWDENEASSSTRDDRVIWNAKAQPKIKMFFWKLPAIILWNQLNIAWWNALLRRQSGLDRASIGI
ncbi:glutamate receptor [Senna tora]|uniref:Glutamate receptor n=1 Tax=Senna tora TaxID=362788 RepID=A0A834X6R7_9FABA|nr:glutamate receptor [Senna tora]